MISIELEDSEKEKQLAKVDRDDAAKKVGFFNPDSFPDFIYRKPSLKVFDLQTFVQTMPLNLTITGIGKRKSGKTEFMKYLLTKGYRDELPWGWAFTHTRHNKQMALFMPEKYILSEFKKDTLAAILMRQKIALAEYLKNPLLNPRAFVIWDDYNGYDVIYNQALKDYYMTGRHYHTLNMFFIQYKNQLPPPVLDNTDILCLWNTDNLYNIEEYWLRFAGKMKKEDFFNMFAQVVETPHTFLMINTDTTAHYDEKFIMVQPELVKCGMDTILGCEEYWKDSRNQLMKIANGAMQREYDMLNELSKKKYHKQPPQKYDVRVASEKINSNDYRLGV